MKKIISICCMLIAIILMLTPFGVAMPFAASSTEHLTKYFSYFSTMPLGYGNWLPMITATLSIVVLFLLVIGSNKLNTRKPVQVILSLSILASALSWVLFTTFTVISALVMSLHIVVLALQVSQSFSKRSA